MVNHFLLSLQSPPSLPPSLPPSFPTGSGKSSLLNALAGRVSFIKGATLEGELLVNGAPVAYGVVRRLCAYVVQVGREGGKEGGREGEREGGGRERGRDEGTEGGSDRGYM